MPTSTPLLVCVAVFMHIARSNRKSVENFRTWFPRIAVLYSHAQLRLLFRDGLVSNYFPTLQFAAGSINYGTKSVCIAHRDHLNLLFGLCAVCVFGSFNHQTSGHLILREAKVILELRRGDMIFFPSAAITHENSPLGDAESRMVLTFYSSGALFRWISQGHGRFDGKKVTFTEAEERAREGWGLLSTMEELHSLYTGI